MKSKLCILALLLFVTLPGLGQARDKLVIVGFKKKPGPAAKTLIRKSQGSVRRGYQLIPALAASLPEEKIAELKKNDKIAYIEESATYAAASTLHADEYENSWGVQHILADVAHASGNKGRGVRIAILDTGIDYNHEDLDDNYRGGYDFVFDDDDPFDDSFNSHGTHMAGIIAAEDNGVGVVGVAPEADVFAVKVLDGSGFGTEDWIISGIDWAVANGVDIISMSIEGPDRQGLREACDRARRAGILVVASGGNSLVGGGPVEYPAAYDSVVAVTATDPADLPGYFAPIDAGLELAAPGVDILSTVSGGGYDLLSGTSQAAAHVAGTAALFFRTNTEDLNGDGRVDGEDVRLLLSLTAIDLGAVGKDVIYGGGLVNAGAAAFSGSGHKVVITDATADGGTVTIKGSGFGTYTAGSITSVTTTTTTNTSTTVAGTIVSWSDTTIVVEFDFTPTEITVNSVFGTATSAVSRSGDSWALHIPLMDTVEMEVTFSQYPGFLLVEERINGQSLLGIGLELDDRVIFWFDAMGAIFFGNVDHDAGTMQGIVLHFQGVNSVWYAKK